MKEAQQWHPTTAIVVALSAVAIVLIANNLWVSLGIWASCACLSLWGKTHKAFVSGLVIAAPAFLGFILMYVPFSEDGWHIALELGVRFLSATTVGLVFLSLVDVDALMRALQPVLPPKLLYVVGSVSRLYPLAQQRLRTIKEIRISRGLPATGIRATMAIVLPLVVGLVDDAAQRARPLTHKGIGLPGKRTVLRPVSIQLRDKLVQVAVVLISLLVIFFSLGGGAWL